MVTALVGGEGSARVAFAVGRGVGGAVVRNRVRRRLRSAIAELDAEGDGLAGGAYLVAASPDAAATPYAQLRDDLRRTLAATGALVRP
jgi:ribonuclease P protein component